MFDFSSSWNKMKYPEHKLNFITLLADGHYVLLNFQDHLYVIDTWTWKQFKVDQNVSNVSSMVFVYDRRQQAQDMTLLTMEEGRLAILNLDCLECIIELNILAAERQRTVEGRFFRKIANFLYG